jgi:hypothetical protein
MKLLEDGDGTQEHGLSHRRRARAGCQVEEHDATRAVSERVYRVDSVHSLPGVEFPTRSCRAGKPARQ